MVKETIWGKQSKFDVDEKELVAMLKCNKQLGNFGAHVVNFLTKERGACK